MHRFWGTAGKVRGSLVQFGSGSVAARRPSGAFGAVALHLGVCFGLLACACEAQVEPGYRGEPFARVHGFVRAGAQPPPASAGAALVWLGTGEVDMTKVNGIRTGGIAYYLGANVQVGGSFPAAFTLDIFDPTPPPQGSTPLPGEPDTRFVQNTIGFFAAVPPGGSSQVAPSSVLGISTDSGVVYLHCDTDDCSGDNMVTIDGVARELAAAYNVPATKGYHLFKIELTEAQEASWFQCMARGVCWQGQWPAWGVEGDFERCQKYSPEAPVCVALSGRVEDISDYDSECQQLIAAAQAAEEKEQARRLAPEPGDCALQPYVYPANPEGFDSPVSITLGLGVKDFLANRLPE